jgi:carboxyl-terminal processing protease
MPVRNIVVIALTAIVSMTCYATVSKNRFARQFAEALQIVEKESLQNHSAEELFVSAMDGVTRKLDAHSKYFHGEDYRMLMEDMDQRFGGVGMYLENDPKTNQLMVLAPIAGTPAFESGIQAGDLILAVDGQPTSNMNREQAISLIRGRLGQVVEIRIGRSGEEQVHALKRAAIYEPSVHGDFRNADSSWNFHLKDYPKIGYIRLLQFAKQTTDETRSALTEIGGSVDSLILDLRDNTGGLLDSAIELSELFLPQGKLVVSTYGRNDVLLAEHVSRRPPVFPLEKPLVVLVNRDSASASEIVAACLQDHGRAVVMGESTWGKGTVQLLIPMVSGRGGLKLTTSCYRPPGGRNIDRYSAEAIASNVWGVQPSPGFEIALTDELVFNIRRLRAVLDLRGLLDQQIVSERLQELSGIVDEPLQRAVEYLLKLNADRIAA